MTLMTFEMMLFGINPASLPKYKSLEGSKVVTNKRFGTGKTCSGIFVLAFELRNWQVLSLRCGTVLSKPIRAWAGGMSSLFQYNA